MDLSNIPLYDFFGIVRYFFVSSMDNVNKNEREIIILTGTTLEIILA